MSTVRFVLDESAMLGPMDAIDTAVGIGRGYGIRLQFYFQSAGQLQKCFPDGQAQTVLSNVDQVYFAVNDTQTAEQISNRLGEETILVTSGGTSSGSSWQHSDGQQASRSLGGSSNSNDNWAQQPRKLLKPEEVLALPPRTAITFTAGFPPICTQLIWQHEEKNLGQQPAPKRPALTQTITLAGWSLRWALMLFLAGCITAGIAQRFSPRAQILPERKIVDPNDNYWKRR